MTSIETTSSVLDRDWPPNAKFGSILCIGSYVETGSQDSIFSSLPSLSFNIVSHKLNILSGSVIIVMKTILGGGLGMA